MIERFLRRAFATLLLVTTERVSYAQSTQQSGETSPAGTSATVNPSALPLPFRGGPLITGYNVWGGSALAVRTASHNEPFDGAALGMVGIQASRSLFVLKQFRFSWLIEVLPAMVATVSAPENRRPSAIQDPASFNDPKRFARYMPREVYGVGIAPLGADVSRSLTGPLSLSLSVTAGAALFSQVVPYGKATQANFTVAPALGLAWTLTDRYAISSGYALHHLSNASFGGANPGLNSHLIFVKLAAARFRARP